MTAGRKVFRVTPEMIDAGASELALCLAKRLPMGLAASAVYQAMRNVPVPAGRPVSISEEKRRAIWERVSSGASGASVQREFGVGRSTIIAVKRALLKLKSEGKVV